MYHTYHFVRCTQCDISLDVHFFLCSVFVHKGRNGKIDVGAVGRLGLQVEYLQG